MIRFNLFFSDKIVTEEMRNLLIKHKIKLVEIDYNSSSINKNLNMSNLLLEELTNEEIDYCFSFGSHILCGDILEQYRNRIINFHPAILPMFPGLNAIDQAVKYGNVILVGNTAHFIDSGIDTCIYVSVIYR